MNITIIHLEDEMLISKKEYQSWREVQDEYINYKASLGPWAAEEVIDYLSDEYASLKPQAEIQVSKLLTGANEAVRLTFND
jgi:hypothetical protein